VVYLETTIEKQLARTQRDKKRPLLQVETPPREVLEALAGERNPLYEEIAIGQPNCFSITLSIFRKSAPSRRSWLKPAK
jgi:shikimate kinase